MARRTQAAFRRWTNAEAATGLVGCLSHCSLRPDCDSTRLGRRRHHAHFAKHLPGATGTRPGGIAIPVRGRERGRRRAVGLETEPASVDGVRRSPSTWPRPVRTTKRTRRPSHLHRSAEQSQSAPPSPVQTPLHLSHGQSSNRRIASTHSDGRGSPRSVRCLPLTEAFRAGDDAPTAARGLLGFDRRKDKTNDRCERRHRIHGANKQHAEVFTAIVGRPWSGASRDSRANATISSRLMVSPRATMAWASGSSSTAAMLAAECCAEFRWVMSMPQPVR